MPGEEEDPKPDPKPDGNDKTFTEDQVNKIVEDRLKRERTKYADYEDMKAKAVKFDQLEGSTKSDLEKAAERAATAEQRAVAAEAKMMRLDVAMSKGLTPGQAKRLQGTTVEELEADADDLLETFKPADSNGSGSTTQPKPNTRPQPDLKGGNDPNLEPEETDPRKLAEKIGRPQG